MADNVVLPGTNDTVHADEYTHSTLGSGKSQLVKIVDATLGGENAWVINSSGAGIVEVRHRIVTVTTSLTRPADTSGYNAGDAITSSTSAPADLTFSNCARISGGSGTIIGAVIMTDNDPATRLSGELWLFDSTITLTNDNAAFSVTDSDMEKLVDIIPFSFFDAGNQGVASIGNLNIGFTCVGSANLYGQFRARAAYTPASAEKFTARLKILQAD
jgi:hypothetical protein